MHRHLISLYKERLDLEKATFSGIEHDDAMVAIVFRVTYPDGAQAILKICPRPYDYLRERYFLTAFAGRLPVPRILQVVEPEEQIYGAILMECFPGAPLNSSDFTKELAYQIGSILARIHLYPARPKTAHFGCAKAPGLNDRKRVHIVNIEPFAIVQPRELSRGPNVQFLAARGIKSPFFSLGCRHPKQWKASA